MIAKYSLGDHRVVLGANRQNDAARLQLKHIALEGEVRLARRAAFSKHDALEPIVSYDPTP